MSNKNLKEKIIKQKYENKNELVSARNNLRTMIKKIRVEQRKAKLKTKKLAQDLKNEKNEFKNKDRVEKLKVDMEMTNELSLVSEHKKLLIKVRSGLKKETRLMKISQKNAIIQQRKKNMFELQNAKKQARLNKKIQKEKIKKMKNKFLNEKNELKKDLVKERQDNHTIILNTKKGLNKTQIKIFKKRKEATLKRKKTKEKTKAKRKARIVQARIEREELKKRKMEAKKKHNERLLTLKGKNYNSHEKNVSDINNLKKSLVSAKNQVQNDKKIFEKEKLEIDKKYNEKIKEDITSLTNEIDKKQIKLKTTIVKWDENTIMFDNDNQELTKNKINGSEFQKVKKQGQRLYDKKNSNSTKLTIKKLKLPDNEKKLFLEMKRLKETNSLIDVQEFAKYVAYLTDTKITNNKVQREIMTPVANLLMKKTIHMLNGYFTLKKIGRYHLIKWTKKVPSIKDNILFPPKTPYAVMFEKVLKQKLEKGAIVKISNNIAIKSVKSEIIVLHDLPFLR